MFRLIMAVSVLATASMALAAATMPTADKKGSKDNSVLKRYEGSVIVAYEHKSFAEFTLPLSRLEQVPDKTSGNNNRAYEPRDKKALEGTYTRLVYLIPENRSPLEVLRNYQDDITGKGGNILFECKAGEWRR
jgi:OOP family OmpA-OmpF porin